MSTYQNWTLKCMFYLHTALSMGVACLRMLLLRDKSLTNRNVNISKWDNLMYNLHTALSMGVAGLRILLVRDNTAPANCKKYEVNLIMYNVRT